MNIRKPVLLAGLLALAAAPFAAQAHDAGRAADACIKSFIESHVPKDRVVRIRVVEPVESPLNYYVDRSGVYRIALTARGAKSGKQFAKARCVAKPRGEVIVSENPS